MYNSKDIVSFIDDINKKAEKAAQDVYDSHLKELETRISNQLNEGDIFVIGNGTAFIKNKKGAYVGETLSDILAHTQYTQIDANFILDDITK